MLPLPDKSGKFGDFGGRYVPETLVPALLELEEAYQRWHGDPKFQQELDELYRLPARHGPILRRPPAALSQESTRCSARDFHRPPNGLKGDQQIAHGNP